MRYRALAVFAVIALCWSGSQGQVSFARGGLGFELGLVVNDDTQVNAGFGLGARGDVAFSLGRAGEVHYKPGVGVWFGGTTDEGVYRPVTDSLPYSWEQHWSDWELSLDIADLAYYFPLPEHVIVRPYAGLGLMVAVCHWAEEMTVTGPSYRYYYDWTDDDTFARAGLNVFAGADFRIQQRMAAFVEMRGRVSRWDLFKLYGGMQFVLGSRTTAPY